MLYLTEHPGRATVEEIGAARPALVQGLAEHPGIGLVVGLSDVDGPVAFGPAGRHRLRDGHVDGTDPLLPYGPYAARDLLAHQAMSNVGDLVLISRVDQATDEVAAFEELVGSHGGIGGWQTDAVLVYPASWSCLDRAPVGPAAVHRQLVQWLDDLGLRHEPPAAGVGSPAGAGSITGAVPASAGGSAPARNPAAARLFTPDGRSGAAESRSGAAESRSGAVDGRASTAEGPTAGAGPVAGGGPIADGGPVTGGVVAGGDAAGASQVAVEGPAGASPVTAESTGGARTTLRRAPAGAGSATVAGAAAGAGPVAAEDPGGADPDTAGSPATAGGPDEREAGPAREGLRLDAQGAPAGPDAHDAEDAPDNARPEGAAPLPEPRGPDRPLQPADSPH
jgi:hypothetical protein